MSKRRKRFRSLKVGLRKLLKRGYWKLTYNKIECFQSEIHYTWYRLSWILDIRVKVSPKSPEGSNLQLWNGSANLNLEKYDFLISQRSTEIFLIKSLHFFIMTFNYILVSYCNKLSTLDQRTGQVRVGLAHEGFRTDVCYYLLYTFLVWGPLFILNSILFLLLC